jgi:hypothetical protein
MQVTSVDYLASGAKINDTASNKSEDAKILLLINGYLHSSAQIPNKFLASYGTRRFVTVFTRARQLKLSSTRGIQLTHSLPFY